MSLFGDVGGAWHDTLTMLSPCTKNDQLFRNKRYAKKTVTSLRVTVKTYITSPITWFLVYSPSIHL